jgi:hypothetical protein
MPSLPSSLALTTIATNAQILSADHRNNYSAIQTSVNGLIDALNDGVTGQFLSGVGSTVTFAYPPGYEYAYNEKVTNTTVTNTVIGSADTVVTASAVTFDGATAVMIDFGAPTVAAGTTFIRLYLFDGSTSLGIIDQVNGTGSARGSRRLTPSAAAHTYSIRALVDAGSGTVFAASGGALATDFLPAFIRITKV